MGKSNTFSVSGEGVTITPCYGGRQVVVEITNPDENEIIEHFDVQEILDRIGADAFLKHIDIGHIIDYYGKDTLFQEIAPDADFESLR